MGSSTGAYRLTLPPRAYSVGVSIDLDPSETVVSTLSFPFPFLELDLSTDRIQNFTVPPLPPFVTISGRVTDSSGRPVVGAIVSAFTTRITNTPNAAFSTGTQTGSDGMYQVRVLSGTNYTILVCPPRTPSPNPLVDGKPNRIFETILRDM
jgi:hypothetical protein